MESFEYSFPAIRGVQAGRAYYLVMCPMRLVPRIFTFDEEEVEPQARAQRILNRSRVPEIARYLVNNPTEYVFSSLTVCVDKPIRFDPVDGGRELGRLHVPMTARFLINDGQHRRAAIEEALKVNPALGDETISIVLFVDSGLKRSQQMFADLNTHAIKPTRSLGILYDHRSHTAELARTLANECVPFAGLTEQEKTTISNRSHKLFTLSAIHQATVTLLGLRVDRPATQEDEILAREFWAVVADHIPAWQQARKRQVLSWELRQGYIHAHGLALQALGVLGRELLSKHVDSWQVKLRGLAGVDWARSNTAVWEGRAMVNGRISKSATHVDRTANYLKTFVGLHAEREINSAGREMVGQR